MLCDVYYNFNRKVFSIRAGEGPHRGRVVAHEDKVTVWGARFHVSAAGRERVLRQKRKNVHAWVRGEVDWPITCASPTIWDEHWAGLAASHGTVIVYDPYKDEGFTQLVQRGYRHPEVFRCAALVDLRMMRFLDGAMHPRMLAMGAVPA